MRNNGARWDCVLEVQKVRKAAADSRDQQQLKINLTHLAVQLCALAL